MLSLLSRLLDLFRAPGSVPGGGILRGWVELVYWRGFLDGVLACGVVSLLLLFLVLLFLRRSSTK